jgi:hypothetical protein
MNWLMRVSVVTFMISLGAWALIAVWTIADVNELLLTWQRIAIVLAVGSGLAMFALLVYRAWIGSDVSRILRSAARFHVDRAHCAWPRDTVDSTRTYIPHRLPKLVSRGNRARRPRRDRAVRQGRRSGRRSDLGGRAEDRVRVRP